jgi:hypothetical protein
MLSTLMPTSVSSVPPPVAPLTQRVRNMPLKKLGYTI